MDFSLLPLVHYLLSYFHSSWDRILLCSSGCELNCPAPPPWVLGLQACHHTWVFFWLFVSLFLYWLLSPRAFDMLGKCSTTLPPLALVYWKHCFSVGIFCLISSLKLPQISLDNFKLALPIFHCFMIIGANFLINDQFLWKTWPGNRRRNSPALSNLFSVKVHEKKNLGMESWIQGLALFTFLLFGT